MVAAPSQEPAGEDKEAFRAQLLEKIATRDADDEDLARHEQFLQAKRDALSKQPSQPDNGVQSALQVNVDGRAFDRETARKLEAIATRQTSQEEAKHREFLKAREEGKQAISTQEKEQSSFAAVTEQLAKDPQKTTTLYPSWISDEEYRALGYPQLDPKFRDREWHKKQLELDSTDPRHNPNLNRDQNDPEFWYHAARKPFNKALLRTEQHWDGRRKVWLKQFDQVKDMNKNREIITDLLEDCSNDLKRLVAPIMHHTITMTVMSNMLKKAIEKGKSFEEVLSEDENLRSLQGIRNKVDEGGDKAAEQMLLEYDARSRMIADRLAEEQETKSDAQEKRIADVHTLAEIINWGNKCKKDGLIEWERGNWDEAHASWKQADDTLQPFQAADKSGNELLTDLHASVLKNLAQVCIKLGYWSDAVKAAGSAAKLCPDDHKAWYRKACALEGLGKLDEAEECLCKVDECSVGRPDRVRITKDTQAKREKLQAIREREQASLKKSIEKALEKNVFSEERKAVEDASHGKQPALEAIQKRPKATPHGQFQDATRKRLTREGAEDLLIALRDAYRDSTFQKQIHKLAHDVQGEKRAFLANLKQVSLPLQKPVLEKFGFEPNEKGLREMMRAVQDYTVGPKADPNVKRAADETTVALYGVMYDRLTRPDGWEDGNTVETSQSKPDIWQIAQAKPGNSDDATEGA